MEDLRWQLIDSLLNSKPNEASIIQNLLLPSKLYKYRSINAATIKMLEDDSVWLTSPFKFNDPYDSSLSYSEDKIHKALIKENFDAFIKKANLKIWLSEEDIQQLRKADDIFAEFKKILFVKFPNDKKDLEIALEVIEKLSPITSRESLSKMNTMLRDSIKLTCFSERNNSLLMWSHYADSHKGICIEYDIKGLQENDLRRRLFYPVIYSETLFDSTDYFISKKQTPFLFLVASLYKSKEWAYEEEWRLILAHGIWETEGKFRMPMPSAIYLGAKCFEHKNVKKIILIARKKNISLYKMETETNSFNLIPVDYEMKD